MYMHAYTIQTISFVHCAIYDGHAMTQYPRIAMNMKVVCSAVDSILCTFRHGRNMQIPCGAVAAAI